MIVMRMKTLVSEHSVRVCELHGITCEACCMDSTAQKEKGNDTVSTSN